MYVQIGSVDSRYILILRCLLESGWRRVETIRLNLINQYFISIHVKRAFVIKTLIAIVYSSICLATS